MHAQSSQPAPGASQAAPEQVGPIETTRLAPSPTGALHLGNARTFLVNWAMARSRGWRIVLRIEDLDTPRNKPGTDREIIDLLGWLGMDWDEGPHYQSRDLSPYVCALDTLTRAGLAYPCELSRSDIEAAASAPQQGPGPHEVRFPPELRPELRPRPLSPPEDLTSSWRFAAPDRAVEFADEFRGPQCINAARTVGDFVVWTKRREPAYQLAVVVDDHRQGVTRVVRGDDLLDSAARQMLLYEALGLAPVPAYGHVPLVVGTDGRRLAKRHGDTRVAHYRERGVPAERVIGLIAWWSGVQPGPEPMRAAEFAARFDGCTMPREKIVFRAEDDAWLCSRR